MERYSYHLIECQNWSGQLRVAQCSAGKATQGAAAERDFSKESVLFRHRQRTQASHRMVCFSP